MLLPKPSFVLIKQFRKKYSKGLRYLAIFGVSVVLLLVLWPRWVDFYYARFIYTPEKVPEKRVAIVYGARVYQDGRLSAMLQDRVETAVNLYKAGKVQKLLLSGDNRFVDYNEPFHMMRYAMAQGVPQADIQLDYAGRRTYDTCYRAEYIFQLDEAVLVTQRFHLPRALFTCKSLGLDVVGVSADTQPYSHRSLRWSELREIPATIVALLDIIRHEPAPVMGQPLPIE